MPAPSRQQVQEYYNSSQELVTGVFSCGFLSHRDKLCLLNSLLGTLTNQSVVDLGCGNGSIARLVQEMGCTKYLGIDLSDTALSSISGMPSEYNFIHGDIRDAEAIAGPGEWHVVLLCDVLEHVPDSNQQIAICKRLLKPGGRLLVVVPNYFNLMGIRKLFQERRNYERDSWAPFCCERPQLHETFMTSWKVRRSLSRNGFRVKSQCGWDIITACSWTPPYAKDDLKGFWKRHGRFYDTINKFAHRHLSWLSVFSLYYIVSAESLRE